MTQSNAAEHHTPPVELTQEIRFAVVMYGGVSLAIYINGITQELLKLVQATAAIDPKETRSRAMFSTDELKGSAKVYRKLGQLLAASSQKPLNAINPISPITTRFIIDILSGTSAGGINSIFLAKALANDQPINELQNLWINEGDIGKLINDQQSIKNVVGLGLQDPPQSLLNSQRMYAKLLEAMEGMDAYDQTRPPTSPFCSPYVQDLDLYITATDIKGKNIPIKLANGIVNEYRYRNVFHFQYGDAGETNDFTSDNTPFLAFAARCTSAFPIAFEPMTLNDACDLLKKQGKFDQAIIDDWKKRFFSQPQNQPATDPDNTLETQAYGDGGYLDNKPFSYATRRISRRRADLPVDRKLIFIDPVPEQLAPDSGNEQKPNVIENLKAAVLTLPRYETIREDLDQVRQRNQLIERVDGLIDANRLEEDLEIFWEVSQGAKLTEQSQAKSQEGNDWAEQGIKEMIEKFGAGYGSYHRLKVWAVTDDLAQLITKLVGFNEESDQYRAIRHLIGKWRLINYSPSVMPGKLTENRFLMDFDINYRLRRLKFLNRKINELFASSDVNVESLNVSYDELRRINHKLNELIMILQDFRYHLGNPNSLKHPRSKRGKKGAEKPNISQNLKQRLEALDIKEPDLKVILEQRTKKAQDQAIEFILSRETKKQGDNDPLQGFSTLLAQELTAKYKLVAEEWETTLDSIPAEHRQTREFLEKYYRLFEAYDMVTFPVFYGTGVGEADLVEIIRISPIDATTLINETKNSEERRKLAGTALGAFGGFLDRLWRENDILWGRLDTAEILIKTLLPGKDGETLIQEAQTAIIAEEFNHNDQQKLLELLSLVLAEEAHKTTRKLPSENQLRKQAQTWLSDTNFNNNLQALLTVSLADKSLYDYFKTSYEVNRQLSPEASLRYASRSTKVIGKLLQGLSAQPIDVIGSMAPWIINFGRILWGLVEVSTPRSFWNLLFRYWLQLLYLIGLLMILGGVFLVQSIQNFGWILLGITVVLNLVIWLLELWFNQGRLSHRIPVRRFLSFVGILLISLFAILGIKYWQMEGSTVFQQFLPDDFPP